jgi:hypothetical protein
MIMAFSRLQPDSATTVGILTAAGVYLIYNNALPSGADVRAAAPHDEDVERSRKSAAVLSAALIAGVFLVARDLNSYIISGAALVGIDYFYKHNNAIHPATGQYDVGTGGLTIAPGSAGSYPLPDYTTDDMDVAG